MENEKGLYVALGVYIGELQKRADLKNDEIRKSVHIGHSTFNDGTDIHIYTGNPSVLGGISF